MTHPTRLTGPLTHKYHVTPGHVITGTGTGPHGSRAGVVRSILALTVFQHCGKRKKTSPKRPPVASQLKMDGQVTPQSIAYAAVQVRHVLYQSL